MSTNLTDLVILSIVARKNAVYTDIISVVKDLAGECWSPTGDVLCEAVEDLISKYFLEIQHSALNGECLQITKTGLEEFSSLLLRLPDRDTEIRYKRLLELVQLRSLDLVPGTVARTIIEQMMQRANSLIEKLEQIATEVSKRLKRLNIAGKTLTLKIKYSDFSLQTRSTTVPYFISSKNVITEHSNALLFQEKLQNSVRLIGISISNLNTNLKTKQAQGKTDKDVSYQLKFEF